MNSQQIEYVLAVEECRSFSKAAKKLFVTQPSLSQYIINTEQKLGFAIFDRSRSPVALTPEGEIFVEYAKRFRELEQELDSRLSERMDRRSAELLLISEVAPLPKAAGDAAVEYIKKIGDVSVSSEPPKSDPAELLKNGSCDAAVTLEKPHADGIESFPLTVWLSVRSSGERSYSYERFLELVKERLEDGVY